MVPLQVGLIATNDGIILRNHIPRILKGHFKELPYYVDLLDLFNEVHCLVTRTPFKTSMVCYGYGRVHGINLDMAAWTSLT